MIHHSFFDNISPVRLLRFNTNRTHAKINANSVLPCGNALLSSFSYVQNIALQAMLEAVVH